MMFYRKRKRPFLLLEVLIAFFLVAICVFPLIYPHLAILKSEKALLERLECEKSANAAFSLIVEKLYRNEISIELLEGEKVLDLAEIGIQMAGQVQFKIEKKKPKEDPKDFLLRVSLTMFPPSSSSDSPHSSKNYYLSFHTHIK